MEPKDKTYKNKVTLDRREMLKTMSIAAAVLPPADAAGEEREQRHTLRGGQCAGHLGGESWVRKKGTEVIEHG